MGSSATATGAGSGDPVDLGPVLRALRRQADLSQRELAARCGVPKSTVARIESGVTDPAFRTVERLVRAAGGEVAVGLPDGDGDGGTGTGRRRVASVVAVPQEGLFDRGGRRYPAHLDVRTVRTPKDWPGAWWAYWYDLPPQRWPLSVPPATYELDRSRRDRRRWVDGVCATLRYRRDTAGLPPTSWRFVAELPDGGLVGELRAHERSVDLLLGWGAGGEHEIVLDGVLVRPDLRHAGVGRRLVTLLADEMDRAGVTDAYAVAEFGAVDFLRACGFRVQASRVTTLTLQRPAPGPGLSLPWRGR
ncbi:GNAT family N-acetyltransferase [Micromonospora sp. WMMD882]|uniref:GNAT family N-acetyltransferase n=1 Tax=Micromonospora sp. WMMD882 TaxID=3015151 RepID=UPI00248AF15F|nr:GNAT family N-acetyltransferase [Micromonospora sp. WMMD882]WBB77856.1 GNAT family N-acetyltransferase [Micromonospora sp. WMMD882]